MSQLSQRRVLVPDESHPIEISDAEVRVRVLVADRWITDTSHALSLKEASYPAVLYLRIADIDAKVLRPSEHQTYCPYKGKCHYFHIEVEGRRIENAIWFYPEPYASVRAISDHAAIYTDRVDEFLVDSTTSGNAA